MPFLARLTVPQPNFPHPSPVPSHSNVIITPDPLCRFPVPVVLSPATQLPQSKTSSVHSPCHATAARHHQNHLGKLATLDQPHRLTAEWRPKAQRQQGQSSAGAHLQRLPLVPLRLFRPPVLVLNGLRHPVRQGKESRAWRAGAMNGDRGCFSASLVGSRRSARFCLASYHATQRCKLHLLPPSLRPPLPPVPRQHLLRQVGIVLFVVVPRDLAVAAEEAGPPHLAVLPMPARVGRGQGASRVAAAHRFHIRRLISAHGLAN